MRLTLLGRREYTRNKRRRCRLNNGLAISLRALEHTLKFGVGQGQLNRVLTVGPKYKPNDPGT